jgi:tRNA (cmo5U34)-methyltransferase
MNKKANPQVEKMADFFDVRAESYDKHMHQNLDDFEEFYSTIAKSIPPTKDHIHILDLGCGTGLELSKIFHRAPNAQLTGIDLSENMLVQLRIKYANHLQHIQLIQGSYLDVSFGEEKYDYVFSVMTVHHLLKQKKLQLYKKIYQSLKKGGKYIEADYVVSKEKEIQIFADYQKQIGSVQDNTDGHYHLDLPMSVKTLSELFTRAGFVDLRVIWVEGEAAILEAQAI